MGGGARAHPLHRPGLEGHGEGDIGLCVMRNRQSEGYGIGMDGQCGGSLVFVLNSHDHAY